MTITIIGEQRIAHLIMDAARHRLCGIGVLSRDRLIRALNADSAEADQLINAAVEQIEIDPVYLVEGDVLENPVALPATSTADLANKLASFLKLYRELPCQVELDLEHGDGHIYTQAGGTIAVSVREVAPTYTVTWMTKWGQRDRLEIPRDLFNRRLGKNLAHRAALPPGEDHRVWGITVRDKHGNDVTDSFDVLTKRADRVPFAEAHIAPGSDTETVIRHLDGLAERHPHLWERSVHGLYRSYRCTMAGYGGSSIQLWSSSREPIAPFDHPLAQAIHTINCIALGLPVHAMPAAVERLIRIATAADDIPGQTLRQWATGEVTS